MIFSSVANGMFETPITVNVTSYKAELNLDRFETVSFKIQDDFNNVYHSFQ